jgi:hypothetical protein
MVQQTSLERGPIPDGPHQIGLLTRLKTPLDLPRADTAGFLRLSKRQGTEPSHAECQRATFLFGTSPPARLLLARE